MLIGQHIGRFRSELPELLARKDRLAPRHGDHGETILAGRFEATPPDRHMLVAATRLHLTHGPKKNYGRPAVDRLFRSARRPGARWSASC